MSHSAPSLELSERYVRGGMDTVMVNTFVVAATAGSISAAARKLRYSESTVAYHVREVERACRVQLFERNMRGFKLTRDGHAALAISEKLLRTASELEALPPLPPRPPNGQAGRARTPSGAAVLLPAAPRRRPA